MQTIIKTKTGKVKSNCHEYAEQVSCGYGQHNGKDYFYLQSYSRDDKPTVRLEIDVQEAENIVHFLTTRLAKLKAKQAV